MASHLQPDHRPDLLRSLASCNLHVRRRAARALLRLGAASTLPLPRLRQALYDRDADTRLSIIRLLAKVGPRAASVLAEATDHCDPAVRRQAVWGLAQVGPPQARIAVPHLVRALRDSDPRVRLGAIWALGTIGPEACAAVPALVDCLADRHRLVSRFTRWALRRMGAGNLAALAGLLNDPECPLRQEVAELLDEIDGETDDRAPTRVEPLMVLVGAGDEATDIFD